MTQKNKNEFVKWMGPVLDCLRAVGGTAKPLDVYAWIVKEHKLPASVTDAQLKSGGSRFRNQVAWARQYMIWEGLLDGSRRGFWSLTPKGWDTRLTEGADHGIFLKWVGIHQKNREDAESSGQELKIVGERKAAVDPAIPPDVVDDMTLLKVLGELPPYGFEKICQRLLHESGFEEVTVTQRSRDGGIDGFGTLRLNPFIGVKVAFQCKRYKGTVSRAEVGDFRNAMLGRAEKGILITTGSFSSDATKEATRDGVPHIELVDGERLVEMFEELKLGLIPKQVFDIDQSFFDQYRKE